jgi:TRAP-type C4-dicarboxylate transport system permease small subunit
MATIFYKICSVFSRIAGLILVFLTLLLVADTIGRFIKNPVTGSYEIVQYGFALIVCFSIAYTGMKGGHISIDLLYGRLPERIKRLFEIVSQLLSILIFALITWRLGVDGREAYTLSERSSTLSIPVSLFKFALALGFAMLALVILFNFLKSIGIRKCR